LGQFQAVEDHDAQILAKHHRNLVTETIGGTGLVQNDLLIERHVHFIQWS